MREWWRLGPLGWRILGVFLAVAVASTLALVVSAVVGIDVTRSAELRTERQLLAGELARSLAPHYEESGDLAAVDLSLAALAAHEAGAHLVVEDESGTVIRGGPVGSGFRDQALSAPVVVEGDVVGTVLIGFPDGGPPTPGALSVPGLLVAVLVALVVAVGMGLVFTRRLTGRLEDVVRATRAFADGDRAARATVDAPGELGEIGRAFNTMAEQVTATEEARRRLSADAAHELRTPLAALQAGLEELRDGDAPPEPETAAALHEQAVRLGRIVEDLSALARAEAPDLALDLAPVDLSDVVSDALFVWRGPVAEAGLGLHTSLRMGVWAQADRDRLHEVVVNLVSNALRHTTAPGSLDVVVREDGDRAVLSVADSGVGIPQEDLPYVMDRLYRGGSRRSGGSGIGLAVVRALVAAHGGEVGIESEVGRGTVVTVRLPRANAPESGHPVGQPGTGASEHGMAEV
jgi:signal transduction histidine kinase